MKTNRFYILPKLPYGYKDLEPYMSEQQLRLHYDKHHQAYIANTNKILEKLDKARQNKKEIDVGAAAKNLSFNLGGHFLHWIFWENLAPKGKGGKADGTAIGEAIKKDYGGLKRFKKEFSQAASTVQGSGWAALTYCGEVERLFILQLEKHNVNLVPNLRIIMVLDIWEHAYYVDYKNEKAKYIEAFWNIINWDKINERFEKLAK